MMKECQSELSLWYLDDGTLGGDAATVKADFEKLIAASQEIGLEVNPGKCEIFCTKEESSQNVAESFRTLAPTIKVQTEERQKIQE